MNLQLLVTLPVDKKHGAKAGKEFKFLRKEGGKAWFLGDAGEEVAALRGEYQLNEKEGE